VRLQRHGTRALLNEGSLDGHDLQLSLPFAITASQRIETSFVINTTAMAGNSARSRLPWVMEVLSMGASIFFLGCLAVLLWLFDGQPIWDYYSLTLNTVVAILSTAAKAAILLPVANCIGQWKWILFSGPPRRLFDFERIDEATRGPMGSVKLLFSPRITQAYAT
jgi:hypothetical protein